MVGIVYYHNHRRHAATGNVKQTTVRTRIALERSEQLDLRQCYGYQLVTAIGC